MTTTKAPTEAQVTQFLEIVNDPRTSRCCGTAPGDVTARGTMTALYRMNERRPWTPAQAYNEMKQYQKLRGFPRSSRAAQLTSTPTDGTAAETAGGSGDEHSSTTK